MIHFKKLFKKKSRSGSAEYFAEAILHHNHTNEEWLQLKEEFEAFYDNATPAEIAYIEESGADDMLYQYLEFCIYGDE